MEFLVNYGIKILFAQYITAHYYSKVNVYTCVQFLCSTLVKQ